MSSQEPSNVEVGQLEEEEENVQQPVVPTIRLVTDDTALAWSIGAIRLAVFADSVTNTILDPN